MQCCNSIGKKIPFYKCGEKTNFEKHGYQDSVTMETSVLMYATGRVLNFPDICLGKVAKFPRREDRG